MKNVKTWIQHSDLKVENLEPHDCQRLLELFKAHPWEAEQTLYVRLEQANDECCPAGIGVNKLTGELLHICQESSGQFFLFVEAVKKTKFLGLFPGKRTLYWSPKNLSVTDVLGVIESFYAMNSDEFVEWVGEKP